MQLVIRLSQHLASNRQVGLLNQEIVGVVGGDGEDAYVGGSQDGGEFGEDAGEAEVERSEDFEAAPVGFGFRGVNGDIAGADDGEFVGGFGEEVKGSREDSGGDGLVWAEAVDAVFVGEDLEGELVHGLRVSLLVTTIEASA